MAGRARTSTQPAPSEGPGQSSRTGPADAPGTRAEPGAPSDRGARRRRREVRSAQLATGLAVEKPEHHQRRNQGECPSTAQLTVEDRQRPRERGFTVRAAVSRDAQAAQQVIKKSLRHQRREAQTCEKNDGAAPFGHVPSRPRPLGDCRADGGQKEDRIRTNRERSRLQRRRDPEPGRPGQTSSAISARAAPDSRASRARRLDGNPG